MKHLLHGTEGEIAVMNVHNGAGQWERLPSKNTKVIFDHWTWQSAERATYEVTRLLRFRGIPAYFPE